MVIDDETLSLWGKEVGWRCFAQRWIIGPSTAAKRKRTGQRKRIVKTQRAEPMDQFLFRKVPTQTLEKRDREEQATRTITTS